MALDRDKLTTVVRKMVTEDIESWFSEAELLISAGMNLQSMDVSLSQYIELDLGTLSLDEKKAAIAEFHRQMLAEMGLPVPERGLDPDPLLLPTIHEVVPDGPWSSKLHVYSPEEQIELVALVERERQELIAHYKADLKRWVAEGRPQGDYRGRSLCRGRDAKSV